MCSTEGVMKLKSVSRDQRLTKCVSRMKSVTALALQLLKYGFFNVTKR